jgi:hypothetical protein
MDTHESNPDNLSDLEQRLAAWKPATQGLKYEDMLFAAGRASARSGRAKLVWPIASACLAVVSIGLGVRLGAEHRERLALVRQLDQRVPETIIATHSTDKPTVTAASPSADSYLALRRRWEQHPDEWIKPAASGRTPAASSPDQPRILHAWQPEGPPEPL